MDFNEAMRRQEQESTAKSAEASSYEQKLLELAARKLPEVQAGLADMAAYLKVNGVPLVEYIHPLAEKTFTKRRVKTLGSPKGYVLGGQIAPYSKDHLVSLDLFLPDGRTWHHQSHYGRAKATNTFGQIDTSSLAAGNWCIGNQQVRLSGSDLYLRYSSDDMGPGDPFAQGLAKTAQRIVETTPHHLITQYPQLFRTC